MDEIELVQVGCKTEAESSSDDEVYYLLEEPSLLEERDEEMIDIISDEKRTEKQRNFDEDIVDLDFKTETTQQFPLEGNASKYLNFDEDLEKLNYSYETTQNEKECQEQCFKYWP